jgi:SAM-dependent methyltransferase
MFSTTYANLYDSIHGSKNYSNEVNQILRIIDLHKFENLRGFDLGCGTGSHAAEFSKLGVEVDGFDVSKEMLVVAKSRYPSLKFSDSIEDFFNDYDFSYSLFDVLSYQTTVTAFRKLLLNLFEHTKSGGKCLVDSWNSSGVRQDPPRYNERIVNSGSGEIIRKVTPDISLAEQGIYQLSIDLVDAISGINLKNEVHTLRAWSPSDVIETMEDIGFQSIVLYNPIDPNIAFSPSDWRFGVKANKP